MIFHPVLIVVFVLLYLFYRYILHPAFISPLSKLPAAHPTAAFLPTWLWLQRRTGYESRCMFAAHQRHGPIVRLAPNEVSVASLDGLRKVYGGTGHDFERTPWFLQFRNYNGTPNQFTMFNPKQHATRRRIVSHLYSKSYLLASVEFQRLSWILLFKRLLQVLDDAVKTDKPVDVYALSCAAGAEFMSAYQVGTGNSLDLVRKGREQVRDVYLENGKKKLMELAGRKKAAKELEDSCLKTCENAERFLALSESKSKETEQDTKGESESASTYPIVYAQLAVSIPEKEKPKSPQETMLLIASEFCDNLEAARVGIGIALTYALYELSLRPALQSELRKELMTLDTPLSYPAPSGQDRFSTSTLRKLDSLRLLDAVLTETLRLRAPVPGPQRRFVPKRGAIIEGYFIPGGVTIFSAAYCLHREHTAFPEAEKWKPERWLELDEAAENTMDSGELGQGKEDANPRRWLWTFSSGGKMCVGNHFANLVLKLLLAAIYTNFTTVVVDDEGIEQQDHLIAAPIGDQLILAFNRAPRV